MLKGINQPEACQYIHSQDASECGDGFLKVGSKAVKYGNWAGAAGLVISGWNFSVKYINKKENTSDWIDLAASTGLVWAGFAASAPVTVGLVVVGGLGYGIYRIGWGDNADLWINNNFGYNNKK